MKASDGLADATAGPAQARRALIGTSARRALRAELGALLEPGVVLGPCRLRRAKLKPGRKLSAYLDVKLPTTAAGAAGTRAVTVTWGAPPAGVEGSAPIERDARRRGVASPFASLLLAAPERRKWILVSPLDATHPELIRLTDPDHVAGLLGATRGRVAVTAVRYRPGQRHVLRYDLHRPTGPPCTIFAKLYASDSGAHAAIVAARVAERLAREPSRMGGAAPRCYVAADRVALIDGLSGAPLSRAVVRSDPRLRSELRRAGEMLRALQSVDTSDIALEHHDLDAEARATGRAAEVFAALGAGLGAGADRVLAHAQQLMHELPAEPVTLVHRDFKLDHLWSCRGALVLLDFDSCAVGDPALDAGKLLADLTWWHEIAGRRGLERAQRIWLDAYLRGAPPERERRARLWEAVWLIKIAAHRVSILDPGCERRAAALIRRAATVLEQLDATRPARAAGSRSSAFA